MLGVASHPVYGGFPLHRADRRGRAQVHAPGLGVVLFRSERPADGGSAMDFDEVARAIEGVPFMERYQGRVLYDHVRQTAARDGLELGTAHGVGSAYMAAALPPGGRVTTVDFADAMFDPSPEV